MKSFISNKLITSSLALIIAASALTTGGLTGITVNAYYSENEPVVGYNDEIRAYSFINTTGYVTARQNGKEIYNGGKVTNFLQLELTAGSAFTYKIGNTMYESQYVSYGNYKAVFRPDDDVTVDVFHRKVKHDDGTGKDSSYIFLAPEYFNKQGDFYVDKSITGGIYDIQRDGSKISFKTILPQKTTAENNGNKSVTTTMDTSNNQHTMTLPSGFGDDIYIVRAFVSEGNVNETELPIMPLDGPATVMHTGFSGKEEEVELGSGFAESDRLMYVDGYFSKSEVIGFHRDRSTGTGAVSVRPGTKFSVYNIFGERVKVTKLGSSTDDRDNYSFEAYGPMSYYLVKGSAEEKYKPHTPGDINRDGKVNMMDAVQLAKYINGGKAEVDPRACDTNGDGKVDKLDVTTLQQYVLKFITTIY